MWCFPLVFGIAGVQLTDTVIYFGLAFSFLGSVTVRMPFSIGSRNLVGLDLVLNADQAVEGDGALALAGLLLSGSLDGEGALDDRVAVHGVQRSTQGGARYGALALAGLLLSGSLDGEGALDDRVAVHAGQRRSEQPVDLILNVPSRESAAETGGRGNAECVGISVAY